MTVLFHGFLGVRTVVIDYIHREGPRLATLIVLYILAIVLFAMGTQVILTLPVPGAS
jgi:succinate dehydrogenase hydrophobic anchor subunit